VGRGTLPGVQVTFEAELWRWDARRDDGWTFVTLPAEASQDVRELAAAAPPRPGFGSVRVTVTIGRTRWGTSVFPDAARGRYVLPVKKAVRRAEGLDVGSVATVTVELADL